ncbi:MAG: MATE family efflux transporter [Holosporaceae bacterium]|jgi:MATE family multidrug resistance protein|nr:MATE family efflux transporter [Holosporaceae bacterium]
MNHKVIDCSLKSILQVTIPLMISMMSVFLMLLIDRVMLASYSIDSMNAAIMSGNFVCIFAFMFTALANTAEIFVGQYNGSKQYNKLAAPVWQMIYMSFATLVISLPIAYFSDHINMLPHYYLEDGVAYQKILMYFVLTQPLRVALAAFFVGQGRTKIIILSVAVGALLNIALDYALIFGIKDIIPSMGCKGAAIATVIAECAQIVILATVFFSEKNREIYRTFENRRFNLKLSGDCFKIGLPLALENCVSMVAWYLVQAAISHTSKDAATIYNIGINVYLFFLFIGEGANKAVAAICSNMIGRGDLESVEKTRKIFVAISVFFGGIMVLPLALYPLKILEILGSFFEDISALHSDIIKVFYIVVFDVVLETLLLSHWGILIAGGDSKYAAIAYQVCLWTFVIIPTILLYYANALTSVPFIFLLMGGWLITTQLLLYRRYKSMKWYNKLV